MPIDRKEFHRWLIDFRRDLHRHPEIAYQEIQTTEKIKTALEELNLEVETFDDMTGCMTVIRGGGEGPTLGLRADIDALPLNELNDVDYKSVNEGTMHACGHDAHATIILGVAKYVVESNLVEKINGVVKLIFQPAEEGGAGAKELINRGALENPNVDWMIGSHVVPFVPIGQVGVFDREALASTDKFVIDIQGAGAHGSRPHESKDPILVAGHIIVATQSIVSRNLDPSTVGVVSFGAMESGTVHNIIPATAKLTGTIRSFDHETRNLLINRLENIVTNTGRAFSVECSISIPSGYPPCINDKEVSRFVRSVAENVVGQDNVKTIKPVTGGDDFAYFAKERPSAFFCLGCGNPDKGIIEPLHSPNYDIDEDVLLVGVDVYTEIIRRYLGFYA